MDLRAGAPALPPAADIVAQMERAVTGDGSRRRSPGRPTNWAWTTLILELVDSNLRQWDLEDTTRDPGADDTKVAAAKREIDRLNLARHRLVEEIDAAIDSALVSARYGSDRNRKPRHGPGSPVGARHPAGPHRRGVLPPSGFADRTVALGSQVAALALALDYYMDELSAGTRRFLRYESFKLYGPPAGAAGGAKE